MPADLKNLGEFGLIRRLEKILSSQKLPPHWLGIGDDAAVLPLDKKNSLLFTHDLLLEGVHFLPGSLRDFRDLGWKALAVNLSDIAAMGGGPMGAVVGLGIPKQAEVKEAESLYLGLREASRRFSCPILGGDTNSSRRGWVIAVSVLGKTSVPPLLRSGARPGDGLWVTGDLGGAALAWQSWKKGRRFPATSAVQRRLVRPEPRLNWGQSLAESGMVTAMIDISDGLAGDLGHLAESSGVGFQVEVGAIPRIRGFAKLCRAKKVEEWTTLISGGEDYELLFTVAKEKEGRFSRWMTRKKIIATKIGFSHWSKKIEFRLRGRLLKPPFKGYTHF